MKTQSWRASVCLHPGLCNILINFDGTQIKYPKQTFWLLEESVRTRVSSMLGIVMFFHFSSFVTELVLCLWSWKPSGWVTETGKEGKMPNSPGNLSANFSQAISQNKNLKCKYCESVCVFCVYKLIYLRCLSFS